MSGNTPYRIRSEDLEDVILECNRVFDLISTRLDRMEGLRGAPRLYNTMQTAYDLVITTSNRGLVLLDTQDPPHFWRITFGSGALIYTDLGTSL